MSRTAAVFLLACIFAVMPVGLPAGSILLEDLRLNREAPEASFVLELVAELAAR